MRSNLARVSYNIIQQYLLRVRSLSSFVFFVAKWSIKFIQNKNHYLISGVMKKIYQMIKISLFIMDIIGGDLFTCQRHLSKPTI